MVRLYVYQEIEFEIYKAQPKSVAARITALRNKPLTNKVHRNLWIPRRQKTQQLTDDPHARNTRHTGVVFQISDNEEEGYIMPDKLYCNAVYFHKNAIQSTGYQKLFKWSEVEFDIKPKRRDNKYDQAVCV